MPEVRGAEVLFFYGSDPTYPSLLFGNVVVAGDEVCLDVDDDYKHLRHKTQQVFSWAAERYDYIFKVDDDVLVLPDRLLRKDAMFSHFDYVGRHRGPSQENDAPRIYGEDERSFCSGFGYWLSAKAARLVAEAPDNGDWAEDRFCGNALARHGIRPRKDNTIELFPLCCPYRQASYHNEKCESCVGFMRQASVLCPYERPADVERLWLEYKQTGEIPTR